MVVRGLELMAKENEPGNTQSGEKPGETDTLRAVMGREEGWRQICSFGRQREQGAGVIRM